MDFRASLAYESNTVAPRTVRTTMTKTTLGKCVSSLKRLAMQEFPKAKWDSLVIVVEKVPSRTDSQRDGL